MPAGADAGGMGQKMEKHHSPGPWRAASHCLLVLQLLSAGCAADTATAKEKQVGRGAGIHKWLSALSFLSIKIVYIGLFSSENLFIKTLWESTGPI